MSKIAIVGGGAAGMMAAVGILEKSKSHEIYLIEKNPILGRKVIISGGGRCNVTTGYTDLKEVLKSYPRGGKFLKTAMYNFPPDELYTWVEEQGVPLKVEKDMRVFPVSNDGKDIVGIFEKIFEKENINLLFKKAVKGIKKSEDKFILDLETEKLEVDKVILTTGGQAYRHTGSTGDGYSLAESLGHSCTDLAASLSSYIVEENWVKELTGVSFPNVQIKFSNKHKFIGPILFTHRGISGPATFALSSLAAFEKFDRETLYIDFVPDKNYEDVKNLIEQYSKANPKKSFYFNLAQFFSKSMAKSICTNLEISHEKVCQELSNKDLNKSIEAIKNTSITLTGKTPGDEFVTAGGVKLEEVNAKTMESRICPGLYFAGELLDIDGFTGGYNLQVAWCTGKLAGESAG